MIVAHHMMTSRCLSGDIVVISPIPGLMIAGLYFNKLVGMFFHDSLSSGPTYLYCSLAGGLILWADLIYHGLDT